MEEIIENPIVTPSIFIKNKSKEMISALRFENIKSKETISIVEMK